MSLIHIFIVSAALCIACSQSALVTFGNPSPDLKLVGSLSATSDGTWKEGPKGFCGIPQTNLNWVACQGELGYGDKLLDKQGESKTNPGAAQGIQSPVNKLVAYPKSGKGYEDISYIRIEYQFALGMGTAKLISGGVGSKSALIQLQSARCSGYAYNVEFYAKKN